MRISLAAGFLLSMSGAQMVLAQLAAPVRKLDVPPDQRRVTIHDQAAARQFAAQRGWMIRDVSPTHQVIELHSIINGLPRYLVTYNVDAADTVSTDECWPSGSSGLDLTGQGVTLGIWDGGAVRTTHVEFEGRATQMDGSTFFEDHPTHVAGTMVGGGLFPGGSGYPVGQSRGMAYDATLNCYDWNNDSSEASSAAGSGLRVSNHSYGLMAGWYYGDPYGLGDDFFGWWWMGDVTVSEVEDPLYGRYDETARSWDNIAALRPYYLYVVSAGNDRDNTGPADGYHFWYDAGDGYIYYGNPPRVIEPHDCISDRAVSKNGLTVGAVHDLVGGYTGDPDAVEMTSFSAWGPTDDGRIKPDVVANGWLLLSAVAYDPATWLPSDNSYDVYLGTSMSSPNVAGSLGLLIEKWRQVHQGENDMRSSTLKAIVIHTADECGAHPGPDYSFGWGLLNTQKAAELIGMDGDLGQPLTITESPLEAQEEFVLELPAEPTADEFRVTICWTDPAGPTMPDVLDNPDSVLVNDLDLRVEAPDGTMYEPWVLNPNDPDAAATTGDNVRDNVEQVVIPDPAEGAYTIHVTRKELFSMGPQYFSMTVSGAIPADCNENGIWDAIDIAEGTSYDCNENGIPDECETGILPVIAQQPADVAVCVGEPASFTVIAGGLSPLTYQWRKDGEILPGAEGPTLSFDATTLADNGEYECVIANPCGAEITSTPATLVASEGPVFLQQPQSIAGCEGDIVTLSVAVAEGLAATYQWRQDGVEVMGATGTSYSLGPLVLDQTVNIDVVVTNICGTVTSDVAVITAGHCLPPSTPMTPQPTDLARRLPVDVDLAWAPSLRARSYDVYFGTVQDPPRVIQDTTGLELELPTLEHETQYFWKVVARNEAGETEGPLWTFITIPPPPFAPTTPTIPNGAVDIPVDVVLGWNSGANATFYQVLMSTEATPPLSFTGTTRSTQWTPQLDAGTTYYWQVIAVNDVGAAPSPVWSFQTAGEAADITPDDTSGSDQDVPTDDGAGQDTPADQTQDQPAAQEPPEDLSAAGGLCPLTGAAMLLMMALGAWGTWPASRRRK